MFINSVVDPEKTSSQWHSVVNKAKEIFVKKESDYGRSWVIFRPESITDQIFIKAQRVRNIQELKKKNKEQKIEDSVEGEFLGMLNYSIIAIMLHNFDQNNLVKCSSEDLFKKYDSVTENIFSLMTNKNNDYGEAWRHLRVASITDLILVKLARLHQIQENNNLVVASEGQVPNFQDIVNYSIFAYIHLTEDPD